MNSVLLGDVLSITGGGTPSRDVPAYYGGSIPWITVKDFGERLFLDGAQETITEAGLENSATRLIPAGSVILVTRMNVGAVAINRVPVAINQDLKALLCKTDLDPLYLLFFMLSKRDQLSAGATGATVKGITLEDVVSLELPLPPLAEQRQIAAILRAADDERRRRRYTQSLSDGLLGEVFVRMFGNPATNPMGWDIRDLGTLLSTLPRIGTTQPASESGRHLCVRVGEIGNDHHVDLESCKYVNLDDEEFARYSVVTDDILLARAIGSEDHLGKFSIMQYTSKAVVFDSHVMRLRLNQNALNLAYFAALMRTDGGRSLFMEQARQTAVQFNVNAEQIQAMRIPVPPIELQRNFAPVANAHAQTRHLQQESARQSDHLFDTLLHRAFAGKL